MMANRFLFTVLLISAGFAICSSQKFSFGSCPTVSAVTNFDVSKYSHVWREFGRTYDFTRRRCVTVEYTDQGNGVIGARENSTDWLTGEFLTRNGMLTFVGDRTVGNFTQTFDNVVTPYTVIATDYTNTAVIYNCVNNRFGKVEYARILRTASATAAHINTALTGLASVGYPLHALIRSDTNC